MLARWLVRLDRLCRSKRAKPVLFVALSVPVGWLFTAAFTQQLGANPAEALIRATGDWTLRFLCIALSVTPLRLATGLPVLARFRRLLGLTVFFYASLHLTAYVWLDMGADSAAVWADVVQRPFIALGLASWLLLLAMALTSFNSAVRWLGAQRWRALHRVVYAVAVLVMVHFWWMRAGKNDFTEVWVYGGVLAALLVARWLSALLKRFGNAVNVVGVAKTG